MFRKTLAGFVLFYMLVLTHTALAGPQVVVRDAWIADAPPNAPVRAGYLQLQNTGNTTLTVQDVSSDDFANIELHKTEVEDGMARMVAIKHLSIAAGETVQFKPGSYHLMLFTPRRKLKPGDEVTMQIRFSNKMTTSFTAKVKKRGTEMHHDHEHHQH